MQARVGYFRLKAGYKRDYTAQQLWQLDQNVVNWMDVLGSNQLPSSLVLIGIRSVRCPAQRFESSDSYL